MEADGGLAKESAEPNCARIWARSGKRYLQARPLEHHLRRTLTSSRAGTSGAESDRIYAVLSALLHPPPHAAASHAREHEALKTQLGPTFIVPAALATMLAAARSRALWKCQEVLFRKNLPD